MTSETLQPDVLGSRFEDRQVADWHPFTAEAPRWSTARAAVNDVAPFRLEKMPLTMTGEREAYPTGFQGIARIGNDVEFWGKVSENYTLIGPADFAAVWDEQVAQPIHSGVVLGKRLVLATELPRFDIGNDSVRNFFTVVNPMDGLHALWVMFTPVKVVCINTLILAARQATLRWKVVHDEFATERLGVWMRMAWEESGHRLGEIEGSFQSLTEFTPDAQGVDYILKKAYPNPRVPERNAPKDVMATRLAKHDKVTDQRKEHRAAALSLFQGLGTGMDDPAMKGTAWGLYNAIAEASDYRRARNESDLDGVTDSLMFGERAAEKQRAYEGLLRLAA